MNFLEFEQPIADLYTQLGEARELAEKSGVDMQKAIAELGFLSVEELRARRDNLESWSQIVLDGWEKLKHQ